jgi:hypothetical protein
MRVFILSPIIDRLYQDIKYGLGCVYVYSLSSSLMSWFCLFVYLRIFGWVCESINATSDTP